MSADTLCAYIPVYMQSQTHTHRPISESTASLDTDQPLHQPAQVSTAPIQPSPSTPVEDDSISVTSQSSEVKQLSTGEAIYEGSVSVDAEEGTGERETLQFEKNVEQGVCVCVCICARMWLAMI